MKKTLLLLVVLFTMGGVNSWAGDKTNADLSKLGNGPVSKWDAATSTMTWTQTSNNMISNFDFGISIANLSPYESITIKCSALTNAAGIRIQMKANGVESDAIALNGDGTHKTNLSAFKKGDNPMDLTKVEWIRLLGSAWQNGESHTINTDNPATVKLEEVYLEKPDVVFIQSSEVFQKPEGTFGLEELKSSADVHNYEGTEWTETIVYPKELAVQGLAFGNGNGDSNPDNNKYVDVTGYDYIAFYVTSTATNSPSLRVWIWDDGTNGVKTFYPHPIADYKTADYTQPYRISGVGTYVCKISGYKNLKGVKAANDWGAPSIWVSMAYMCKGEPVEYQRTNQYKLVGESTGSASLTAALADETATLYDATGLTNTSAVALNTTNPNALFLVADVAKLSNTKNVMTYDGINYSSSNIELVDDNLFYAPFDILSTASSYTRNFDAAEAWGSAVLPFALNVDDNSSAAKFYVVKSATETSATFDEVTTGIIPANSPFVYQTTGSNVKFLGATISATINGYNLVLIGDGWYQAQSMVSKVIEDVTTDDFFKDYDVYGISGENLVHATKKLTLKPFRAFYLKEKSGGEAPARLSIEIEDEATAIADANVKKAAADAVYNIAGQRVGADYKGIVIDENGKKYLQK